MTGSGEAGASLIRASDTDKPIVARLIQLYLYDMAAQDPFPIGADGAYAYDYLDRFCQHPYLFHLDGQIAGFALVIDHCPITQTAPCWFMAEYFVLRPYRQQALGRTMFHTILNHHSGRWHIATQSQNRAADAFWDRAIPTASRQEFSTRFDDANWTLRAFDWDQRGA